jgi:hypothetical protein
LSQHEVRFVRKFAALQLDRGREFFLGLRIAAYRRVSPWSMNILAVIIGTSAAGQRPIRQAA